VVTPSPLPLRLCVIALFWFEFASAAAAAPYITLNDEKYFLADTESNDRQQLREYLPKGETLANWERLTSIRITKDLNDPESFLHRLASQVVHDHPAAKAWLLQNTQTKAFVLDFMTFPPDKTRPYYAEWNLMRAVYVEGKGLVVYQYASRLYDVGPQIGPIVVAERNKIIGPFSTDTFEEKEDAK